MVNESSESSSNKVKDSIRNAIYKQLFESLDAGGGYVTKAQIISELNSHGITPNDPRLASLMDKLAEYPRDAKFKLTTFADLVSPELGLIEKTLSAELVVPDFASFAEEIESIYLQVQKTHRGKVADYIPQLARVDPSLFGVAICTVDGQRYSVGDSVVPFCIESICKPIIYCLTLEELGADLVHLKVGREPSGRGFNQLTLNQDGIAHNPMINAGAITCCSLLRQDLDLAERFEFVMEKIRLMSGGRRPGFNNSVFLSERETADRNFALGYLLKEKMIFPDHTRIDRVLEFYFQCCSIEFDAESLAILAATLANAGICPLTGSKILSSQTVKNCLCLMQSCGLYDFSGEFAFVVGLPAKSSVSGAILLVVPNVMGIVIFSPRLDPMGNSVQGVEFSRALVEHFNFHPFDSLVCADDRRDPRLTEFQDAGRSLTALCWAASQGDIIEIKHCVAKGVDLSQADYDGRTALHLAVAHGHKEIVKFLINKGVNVNCKDHWGDRPLDDAMHYGDQEIIDFLKSKGAIVGGWKKETRGRGH